MVGRQRVWQRNENLRYIPFSVIPGAASETFPIIKLMHCTVVYQARTFFPNQSGPIFNYVIDGGNGMKTRG